MIFIYKLIEIRFNKLVLLKIIYNFTTKLTIDIINILQIIILYLINLFTNLYNPIYKYIFIHIYIKCYIYLN